MRPTSQPTVEDRMSTSVVTVTESDTVETLRREMRSAHIHHIPVVDRAQHVVGIVSSRDLGEPLTPNTRVGDIMIRDVITVQRTEAAQRALWILLANGFHSLPVVGEDEQLVGIVTARDLDDVMGPWAA